MLYRSLAAAAVLSLAQIGVASAQSIYVAPGGVANIYVAPNGPYGLEGAPAAVLGPGYYNGGGGYYNGGLRRGGSGAAGLWCAERRSAGTGL